MSKLKSRESAELSRPRRLARRSCLLALGALSTWPLLAASGTSAGAVTGSVVDDSGIPVAGARVLIGHTRSVGGPVVAAPPVITGPLATMVVANAHGSFTADGLAPGQYIACAETTQQGLLDTCHWAASATGFMAILGQTASGVRIVMATGAVLRIHVNDPLMLLKPAVGPVDFNLQIHIVTSKGIHYGAPIQSSTATGRDFAITIPFGTPVALRVLSAHLVVNDQSGKPVAPLGMTINVPAGTIPQAVALTIAGKK